MSEHGAPDVSWVQWALGGLGAACLAAVEWLRRGTAELRVDLETVRKAGEAERDALWERLNAHVEHDEQIHRDAERYFASKDDIKELKARISESEGKILAALQR